MITLLLIINDVCIITFLIAMWLCVRWFKRFLEYLDIEALTITDVCVLKYVVKKLFK